MKVMETLPLLENWQAVVRSIREAIPLGVVDDVQVSWAIARDRLSLDRQ